MLRKTKAVEKSIELNWKRRPVAHRTRTSKENKYLALVGFSSTPSPCQLTQPQCQPLILSSLFLADRSLYSLQTYLRGRRSWCKRQQNRMVFSSSLCSMQYSSSYGTVGKWDLWTSLHQIEGNLAIACFPLPSSVLQHSWNTQIRVN